MHSWSSHRQSSSCLSFPSYLAVLLKAEEFPTASPSHPGPCCLCWAHINQHKPPGGKEKLSLQLLQVFSCIPSSLGWERAWWVRKGAPKRATKPSASSKGTAVGWAGHGHSISSDSRAGATFPTFPLLLTACPASKRYHHCGGFCPAADNTIFQLLFFHKRTANREAALLMQTPAQKGCGVRGRAGPGSIWRPRSKRYRAAALGLCWAPVWLCFSGCPKCCPQTELPSPG